MSFVLQALVGFVAFAFIVAAVAAAIAFIGFIFLFVIGEKKILFKDCLGAGFGISLFLLFISMSVVLGGLILKL
ncbi:MAG: hypothetical protein AABY22_00555 [Nanoarchaeota archaeon]